MKPLESAPASVRDAYAVLLPGAVALIAVAGALLGAPAPAAWSLAWTAAAVSACAGMHVARRTADHAQRARWTWWLAAAGAKLVAQLAWDVHALVGADAARHVADAAWYAFAIAVVGGLLRTHDGSRGARSVAAMEVVALVPAAMALTGTWLWKDWAASTLPAATGTMVLLYPALYVAAAVVTLQAIMGGALRRVHGRGPRVVLAGIVVEALAFIWWSKQLLGERYEVGASFMDAAFVVGLLAMATGGLLAARSNEPAGDAASDERWGGVLPGLMFLLLVGHLVGHLLLGAPHGTLVMLSLGVLLCGVLLLSRAALLDRRMRVLLARERMGRHQLAASQQALATLNDRLLEDVRRDALTTLRNRRALAEDLPALQLHARRHGETFAIAVCDIDHFKAYNDALGHLAGDDALRIIATTMRDVLRAGDVAYRYGGEEFVLVLRSTDAAGAHATAERVRAAVAGQAIRHPEAPAGIVTVSLGLAAGAADAGDLLARADGALFDAKRAGRDQVAVGGDAHDGPLPLLTAAKPIDEPAIRHARGLLSVARAAAQGHGMLPVFEALAHMIRSEMRFQAVVVNLYDAETDELRVVLSVGDEGSRDALAGTSSPLQAWAALLGPQYERHGAAWAPAGSYDWDDDSVVSWRPPPSHRLEADAWDPDDLLLLPLRTQDGELLGVVSVDEPLSGRRPDDAQVALLMAAADHATLALDRARQDTRTTRSPELRLAAVLLLAETLDLRDAGTAAHSRTVGTLAARTATALGLAEDHVHRVHAAGVLHDLGKLGIADAILHKPTALDDAEWREIKRHPEVGARILHHAGLEDIAAWIRAHHERIDGRGYPDGVAGDAIPLEARILAVADSYEAMVADRPYRDGMPPEEARAELRRCAGTQFDAEVVDAFLRAVATVGDTVAV